MGSPNRILAAAALAGAATFGYAETAQAHDPATVEIKELDLTLTGTVIDGVLHGTVDFGGLFGGTKLVVRKPLAGLVPPERLAELEGHEFTAEVEGETQGGVFRGTATIETPIRLGMPLIVPITELTGGSRDGAGSAGRSRAAAKPARRAARTVAPEPADTEESAGVRLVKPHDPKTYYADRPETGKNMGPGNPRGFDITKDKPSVTFYVTGPGRIQIQLFPWVHADEAKRKASGMLHGTLVSIDGEEREVPPQHLAAGKILATSKTTTASGEIALWDTPVTLPPLELGHGTHEVKVTMDPSGYSYRAMLTGATETSKPAVIAAMQRPLEEDPNTPAEISVPCRLVGAPDAPAGYRFEEITPNPLVKTGTDATGLAPTVQRLRNSALATVRLAEGTAGSDDSAAYELKLPLVPNADSLCQFTRTSPPAESTVSGPQEFVADVKVEANGSGVKATLQRGETNPPVPGTMKCLVNNVAGASPARANFHCWDELPGGVRAYAGTLDTRAGAKGQVRRTRLVRQ